LWTPCEWSSWNQTSSRWIYFAESDFFRFTNCSLNEWTICDCDRSGNNQSTPTSGSFQFSAPQTMPNCNWMLRLWEDSIYSWFSQQQTSITKSAFLWWISTSSGTR
jgi:hypothetical protein